MITLHFMMLVAMGALLALLVVIAVLPAYRRRVERLTSDRIRRSIPITEAEIRADKDRLRAQFAIRVHKLEAQGEQQKMSSARQRIEMSRRDARVTELETDVLKLSGALEEHVNARRVLEHTVTDRLPRLEQQLDTARNLIAEREQMISSLKTETTRSVRALDEAMQMNAQQRSEIERVSSSLASRSPVMRDTASDPRFDGEIALRSEIEALRAKTRDQAQLLARLQMSPATAAAEDGVGDVDRLKRELTEAESALKSVRDAAHSGSYDRAAAEAQAAALIARIDEQAAMIAQLKAGLASYDGDASADGGGERRNIVRDGRMASKAKVNSLQAQLVTQSETIQKLRAELAASNERLARQAAHFMDEMRRIGAGTVQTSAEPRRAREPAPRRSLSDRISQPKPAEANGASGGRRDGYGGEQGPTSAKVAEFIKALSDKPAVEAAAAGPAEHDATFGSQADAEVTTLLTTVPHDRELALEAAAIVPPSGDVAVPGKRKLRLLDRISGVGKS